MDCHRPKDAWWLCAGCADVCATPASLLHLARLGYAGHQLDIFVFGDSSELPGQKTVTLTLFLFLFLLCSHPLYLRAWALCCYGPECLRRESHFSCLKHRENLLCLLHMLKGWNHIQMWSNLRYKKVLKQGNGTHVKSIIIHRWELFACPDI